jgi:hypothetical protein
MLVPKRMPTVQKTLIRNRSSDSSSSDEHFVRSQSRLLYSSFLRIAHWVCGLSLPNCPLRFPSTLKNQYKTFKHRSLRVLIPFLMAYRRVPPSTQAPDIEAVPNAEADMASQNSADVSPDASPPALLSVTAQKEVARRLAAVTGGSKGLGFWETKVQDFNRRRSSLKLPRSRSIVSEVRATDRKICGSVHRCAIFNILFVFLLCLVRARAALLPSVVHLPMCIVECII